MIKKIINIELIYVLYLLSGFIKSFFIAFDVKVPVDITLFLGIVLVVYLTFTKINLNKKNLVVLVLFFIFYLWMLVTSIYTKSESYWIYKIVYSLTNVIAFLVPILLYKRFNVYRFIYHFIVISTFLNTLFVTKILPFIYINKLYYQISGQYLAVALFSGLNILFIVVLKVKFKNKFLTLFILILNFIDLILSGGRGGLIFTFLILFVYVVITQFKLLLKFKISLKLLKILIFTFLLIFMSISYYFTNKGNSDLLTRSIGRLLLIEKFITNSGNGGKSVNARIDHIHFSLNYISKNLHSFILGYGIGSYGIIYANVDARGYPHNIILEIWFEMGLIGVILFFVFILYIMFYFSKNKMIWIFLYIFLSTLKSGNLSDLRIFFSITSLLIVFYYVKDLSYEENFK